MKEFWSADGITKYHKAESLIIGLREAFGEGIVFSEG